MMRFLDIVQGSTLTLGGQYVPPIKHTIIDTNTCEVAECLNTVDLLILPCIDFHEF